MVTYESDNSEESLLIYKKATRKFLMRGILTLLAIYNVAILLAVFYFYKVNLGYKLSTYFIVVGILLLIEIVVVSISFSKVISHSKRKDDEGISTITFDEDGVKFYNEEAVKHIKWSGIKDITIYDKYMIVENSINTISSYILPFRNFDKSKDEVIDEIEKYIEVRRR